MIKKISFVEGKKLIDNEKNLVFFDVREEEEYLLGHAAGATLFPLDSMNEESAKEHIPNKDTIVLVYCRSGNRSHQALLKLQKLGYNNLYDLGGLTGWPYGIEYDEL